MLQWYISDISLKMKEKKYIYQIYIIQRILFSIKMLSKRGKWAKPKYVANCSNTSPAKINWLRLNIKIKYKNNKEPNDKWSKNQDCKIK